MIRLVLAVMLGIILAKLVLFGIGLIYYILTKQEFKDLQGAGVLQ